ncbi:cell wall lytic activity [Bacillus sp. HMF5848]|uniref:C40 family peptidase n=1 Tax=Bacillus sp. HMF5848 TaxID=2495421 RepID=UPI000F7A39C6|nr:peptidoglycan-binding protein [Bacillus sp. HMF5848]RSK27310.1 cell wall lytic activity [Bacillus sp. HMF5848]
MVRRNCAREALVLTTVAAGVFLASPTKGHASDNLDPTMIAIENEQGTLRYGYKGIAVKEVQKTLNNLYLYTDKIDGIFGPNTKQAVMQFQAMHGIKVDGIVGPQTWKHLEKSVATAAYKKPLQLGDSGTLVMSMQKRLQTLNYYTHEIDGIFGSGTKKALIEYQTRNALRADGIGVAGPQTLAHLLNNINKKGVSVKIKKVKKQVQKSVDTAVVTIARKFLGSPYKWGGTSPTGFDCSGFLQYVFAAKNIKIPRTVSDIWNFGSDIGKASIGDIVFFETYKPGPSHAGIYIGNNKFIHASSDGVMISNMHNSYWKKRFLGVKRISN